MIRIKYLLIILLLIFILSIVSCEQSYIGKITIKNNSGQEVTDIMFFVLPYYTRIDRLLDNESIIVRYDFINENFSTSARTVTGSAGIVYLINDVYFDMNDGNDSFINIGSFFDTIITINADGWIATTSR